MWGTVTHESHALVPNVICRAWNASSTIKPIVILALHAVVAEGCVATLCAVIARYPITLDASAINPRSSVGTRDAFIVFTQIVVIFADRASEGVLIAFRTIR